MRLLRADEIDCRVASVKDKGFTLLLYKNARVDMQMLDEEYGQMGWKRSHQEIDGRLYCTISVYDHDKNEWVSKQDVGTESYAEKEKGQASDSFKRAGFNWSIGRELYTAPFIWISDTKYIKDKKVYERFKVKEIEYDRHRNISHLVIVDSKSNEKYKYSNTVDDKPDEKLYNQMFKLIKVKNKGEEAVEYISKEFKKNSSKDMTKQEVEKTIEWLKKA